MMGFYKFEGQHIQVEAGVQDLTSDKNQQEEQEQFDSIQEENKQTEGEGVVESMDCTVENSVRELEPENLANIKSEMSSSMFPDLVASVTRHKEDTLKIHEKMDVLLKQEKELEHTLSGIHKEIYEVEKDLKQRHCRLIESINYLSHGAPIKINTTVNLEKEYFEDDASSSSSISVGTKKKNFEKIRPKRKQTTTTQRISPAKKILNGGQNKSFVNGGVCRVSDVDGDILKFIDDGIIPVSLTEHTVKEELEKGIAYCMQKRNIAKKGFVCMVERICEWCTSSKFYHENEITQRKVREAMDIMLQVVKNEERKWKNGKDLHGWVLRDLEKWGSWEYPQKFNMGKTND